MTQLEKLKMLLDVTDQDGLLQTLLEDAEADVLTWTNRAKLPIALEATVRQVAIIRYNMQGVEGQTTHSEGGISRSFDLLPKDVQQSINAFRLLKAVRHATKKT